ncbi:MAG TPA: phosphate ABC transporter permease subunit PstC [Fimbriimonas sp.]|nr:phosphate ABC transporter permease subunit PstC [Fimbriimonas sp.]
MVHPFLVRKSRTQERVIRTFCLLCAAASILITAGIIAVLAKEAFTFFTKVSPITFFTGKEWYPSMDPPKFGVLPLFSGTLLITLGSAFIAVPLGLLAAIYLSEYASPRARKWLKPILELLAGIPTVVYGYFGLTTITPWLQKLSPDFETFNGAAGAIVVGIMTLPLVASLCEDAIKSVPKQLREGAYGLGATKFEVTMKIVVPAAFSGIMAAVILAISRAVGETMAVALAAGQAPKLTLDPRVSIETMTAFIVQTSKGDIRYGSTEYQTIYAVGLTLFATTFILNIIALRLVKRFRIAYT